MFDSLKFWEKKPEEPPEIISDTLMPGIHQKISQTFVNSLIGSIFDGEKFPGGFGATNGYEVVDYWTLRERSVQLFTDNIYASGLIKRLITNVINTGLSLEATPAGDILGKDDDFINDWSENTETLYRLWGQNKELVDWKQKETDGGLQAQAKKTALLSGDCLVVLRTSRQTGLPVTELIDGRHVQQPTGDFLSGALGRGNTVQHGVEIDSNGRHVAFFVKQKKGLEEKFVRIPVKGPKSGRKIAWLLYGSKRLLDDVRGVPLLGIVLQSLREIDRYRDAEQRAAAVNAFLAMFIRKDSNKPGTRPLSGEAVRKDTAEVTDGDGSTRDYQMSKWLPGMAMDELAQGEEPVSFDTKRPNVNFAVFEAAILSAIAWANEIPPEILKLAFNSNYSASRMADSEFKIFLNKERSDFADNFTIPRYKEWLVGMVLTDRIQADGLLEAWRDPAKFEIFGAWTDSDWAGAIKPHIDPLKEVNAKIKMVEAGFITRDRASKELTGMKFTRVAKQLKRENQQILEANQVLIDSENQQQMTAVVQKQLKFFGEDLFDIIKEQIGEHLNKINHGGRRSDNSSGSGGSLEKSGD